MESIKLDMSVEFPSTSSVDKDNVRYYLNEELGVAAASLMNNAEEYTIQSQIEEGGKSYPVIALTKKVAWGGATDAKKINIPNSILYIYPRSFDRLQNLEELIIPEGVKYIGTCAMHDCVGLKKLVIPTSVEEMGQQVLWNCDSLKTLEIGATRTGVEMFSKVAGTPNSPFLKLYNKKMSKLVLLDGIEVIDERSFAGCKALKSVSIPDSVQEIRSQAFRLCPKLTTATVPASAQIAEDAFDPSCQVYVKGSDSPLLAEGEIILEMEFNKTTAEMTINGEPFAYQCHKKPNRSKLLKVLERQNAGILDEMEDSNGSITLSLKYKGTVDSLKSGIDIDMWDIS